MTVESKLKQAQVLIGEALTELNPAPTPPPPSPPSSFLKGLCAGYWGAPELADLKASGAQVFRLGTPNVATTPWSQIGKVIYLQEGDTNGSYNAGGVQAINVQAFVAQMGKVAAAHPDIYALEILNEPGGSWFWGANAMTQANAAAYSKLVRAVWEARKTWATKPLLLVSVDGGHRALQWWEWMVAADPRIWECFDNGTVHAYGGTGERQGSALGDRKTILTAFQTLGKPIAVTEIGWPTIKATGDSLQWTEEEQKANLAAFLQWAKITGVVSLVAVYNYRDGAGAPGYGLVRADGSRKPAFQALAAA